MHEDLLGYLLGALQPHEMERVEELLRRDPDARRMLAQIQRSLDPLQQHHDHGEIPPAGLVQRTLDNLPPLAPPDPQASMAADESLQPVAPRETASSEDNQRSDPWHASGHRHLPSIGPSDQAPRSRGLTAMDVAALFTAAAVLLALLIPHVANGRFESRRAACQDQLRELGVAITSFVNRDGQGRLPAVSESGPEAFAGVYAVRLRDAGLLPDDALRWCPSRDAPGDQETTFASLNALPSLSQLRRSSVDALRRYQEVAGGHYAYTLGVIDQDRYASPRFESRSSFAVMADAPMTGVPSQANFQQSIGHDGRGINVLYEDGRVRFVAVKSLGVLPDHPFFNHRGQVEAGVNIDDAALAPSWRPPFVEVFQR